MYLGAQEGKHNEQKIVFLLTTRVGLFCGVLLGKNDGIGHFLRWDAGGRTANVPEHITAKTGSDELQPVQVTSAKTSGSVLLMEARHESVWPEGARFTGTGSSSLQATLFFFVLLFVLPSLFLLPSSMTV